jgi:hypothetical protein
MAALALHDKKAEDPAFLQFLLIIKRGAVDQRNFVKKRLIGLYVKLVNETSL